MNQRRHSEIFWVEPFVHYKKYMVYKIMIYEEKYLMESMTIKKSLFYIFFYKQKVMKVKINIKVDQHKKSRKDYSREPVR